MFRYERRAKSQIKNKNRNQYKKRFNILKYDYIIILIIYLLIIKSKAKSLKKLEENNYHQCPNDTKFIVNKNICIDNCINDNQYKYEYNNLCYENCPKNSKIIENTNICIDNCINTENNNYEYNNTCFNKCPNSTYYYNKLKICYDKIPSGFYCNDTEHKTLDKCHENCKECNGPNDNNCLSCPEFWNIYLNLGKCIDYCENGFFIDIDKVKVCKCIHNKKCYYCNEESNSLDLCVNCNKEEGYYQKIDDEFRRDGYVDCYKDPEGYYLSNGIYTKCYNTCKFCTTLGSEDNHKCTQCFDKYILINDFQDIYNCFNCNFYYYYDKENNKYKCTFANNCPEKYNKLVIEKRRCIDYCKNDDIYKYEYKNKCYKSCPENSFLSFYTSYLCENIIELEEYKEKSMMLEKELNFSNNEISEENINYITFEYLSHARNLTNLVEKMENDNYKIYIYKNISALKDTAGEAPQIDFGECYNKVKNHYNIKEDLLIILIQNQTDESIYGRASIKYTFSHPETGKVLNTYEICSRDTIIITEDIKSLLKNIDIIKIQYFVFLIEQGINIFNLSDKFYNDICYYFESPNGKDVPILYRIAYFYPNISLCDYECSVIGFDLKNLKAKCECRFNNLMNKILRDALFFFVSDNFDFLYFLNLQVLKCIGDILNIKYFKKCVGGFVILSLSFIQFIFEFLFIKNGLREIRRHIYFLIESFSLYNHNINIKNNPPRRKKSQTYIKNKKKEDLDNISKNSKNKIFDLYQEKSEDNKNSISKSNSLISNKIKIYPNSKEENNRCKESKNINNIDESDKYIKIINEYLNNSFDENNFCDVVDKETRTFCTYFCEEFKHNQILFNTFYVKEIFRPRTFKIILFLISIESYLVSFSLLYNDEYLNEIFKSNKSEIFSLRTLANEGINDIIEYLIGYFSIEEGIIKNIFKRFNKDCSKIKLELLSTLKNIKKRYVFFFLFAFFFQIFSFLYICCFNIVYPHIRMAWIKSTLVSLLLKLVINFLAIFFSSCIRYIAIKCNSEKLFKLRLLIQIFY